MSNTAFASAERRYLEEPDRRCVACLEAPCTAPDGLCDECVADVEEARRG